MSSVGLRWRCAIALAAGSSLSNLVGSALDGTSMTNGTPAVPWLIMGGAGAILTAGLWIRIRWMAGPRIEEQTLPLWRHISRKTHYAGGATMELVLPFVIIVLLLACGRKAANGRRCDLGLVVVMLSLVLLVMQLQAHG
jgi:hypothetical protein